MNLALSMTHTENVTANTGWLLDSTPPVPGSGWIPPAHLPCRDWCRFLLWSTGYQNRLDIRVEKCAQQNNPRNQEIVHKATGALFKVMPETI